MKTTFETLIRRIAPKLHGITHRLNGHFTFFNDDDLYQEALIHLWASHRIGTLDDKTDSYVLQGCYFHLKNYIRTAMDKGVMVSISTPLDSDDTPLEAVIPARGRTTETATDEAILNDRLTTLNLTTREETVISFLRDGLTTREIGERLGISHVMVVKIKGKIRKKLAGRLPT